MLTWVAAMGMEWTANITLQSQWSNDTKGKFKTRTTKKILKRVPL